MRIFESFSNTVMHVSINYCGIDELLFVFGFPTTLATGSTTGGHRAKQDSQEGKKDPATHQTGPNQFEF